MLEDPVAKKALQGIGRRQSRDKSTPHAICSTALKSSPFPECGDPPDRCSLFAGISILSPHLDQPTFQRSGFLGSPTPPPALAHPASDRTAPSLKMLGRSAVFRPSFPPFLPLLQSDYPQAGWSERRQEEALVSWPGERPGCRRIKLLLLFLRE